MTVNDVFHVDETGVADGGEVTIDGSSAGTGAAEVFELGGTGAAELYKESDPDGDGVFEVSVQIDVIGAEWHSQLNQLVVSQTNNVRLRIVNSSGGSADYYGTGMEVDDA